MKLSLLSDDMIVYIRNSKELKKKKILMHSVRLQDSRSTISGISIY